MKYRSRIDLWLLAIMLLYLSVLIFVCVTTTWLSAPLGILCVMAVAMLFSVWYEVDNDTLTVYNLFRPTRIPVGKIAEVRYCRGYLAGAAMSSKRLSIKMADRSVLRSSMPLEISPKDRDAFVDALLRINPSIRVIR